jgi:hypothetical protein
MPKLLKECFKEKRKIKDSTINTYMSALNKIRFSVLGEKLKRDFTDKDVKFLNKYDDVSDAISKEKKITSKKNKLTSILVALHCTDGDKKLIDKYTKDLKGLDEIYSLFLRKQEKTETQKKNWIEFSELVKISNKLMQEIRLQDIHKLTGELNNKQFDLLQQYVILRTYLDFPLRNDYADMPIVNLKDYNDIEDDVKNDTNYLVTDNKKKYFYINQFKNKSSLGNRVFKIGTKLNNVIRLWLKHNKSGFYLVQKDRVSPIKPNGITKLLNKIFNKYANGKRISSSMIRHIIISHDLKDEPTIAEKDEKANVITSKFLHSNAINQLYRKVDKKKNVKIAKNIIKCLIYLIIKSIW